MPYNRNLSFKINPLIDGDCIGLGKLEKVLRKQLAR